MLKDTLTVQDAAVYFSQLTSLITTAVDSVLKEYTAASRPVPTLDCTDPSAVLSTQGIRDAIRVLEAACGQLIASIAPAEHVIMNRVLSGVDQACMHVVTNANIADQLSDGSKHVSVLAANAGTDAGQLGRVLRNLAVKHCFSEVSQDVFANNRLSVCLMSGSDMKAMVDFVMDEQNLAWMRLPAAMTIDKPGWVEQQGVDQTAYALAHGHALFKLLETEPWRSERFSRAMLAYTALNGGADEISRIYPWASVPPGATFCDVGGALGHVPLALRKMHPHIKAVVQDKAPVVDDGCKLYEKEDPDALTNGDVRFIPVNFLEDSPVDGCEFYYLKHILHDWPDADCVTILKNVKKAMTNKTAKILIHDIVLQDATQRPENVTNRALGTKNAPSPLLANFGTGDQRKYMMDITMLVNFNAAERTLDRFIDIGSAAGLRFSRLWEGGEVTVLEFTLL